MGAKFQQTLLLLQELNIEPNEIYGHTIVDEKLEKALIHEVAESGNVEVLKELLQQEQCNINLEAQCKYTPLHFALIKNHVECLKILIAHGANKRALSDSGLPLHVAALEGSLDCLNELISEGAEVNEKEEYYGNAALQKAAKYGHLDCLIALINAGADPKLRNEKGQTALHYAAMHGKVDCLKELIKHGADPKCHNDHNGDTPLHSAARNGELVCLQELIYAGADPEQTNDLGFTALDVAVDCSQPDCVDYLKDL